MNEIQPVNVAAARPRSTPRRIGARGPPGAAREFPVVGIGASAGGLEACRKLVGGMPAKTGMAFILIQHLDPTHESMMVDLLADYSAMPVRQAEDGMRLAADHLYVIPPGTYLSVALGALRLSEPVARHGARLPFDFLLHSMAEEFGASAIAVILSGSGADGSLGLKSVKERGGFVIAQDPVEAGYDGMPRSAVDTGDVDEILPIAEIPAALARYAERLAINRGERGSTMESPGQDCLTEIIDLVRTHTPHDFRLYKLGTLQRRIERRMTMAGIETADMARYLGRLQEDPEELKLLSKDLLINVTNFFRDIATFDHLSEKILPDLVRDRQPDQPLRIWVPGCSSGEEAYSIAILFREAMSAAKSNTKLQVFASDVDPDMIASAREGIYPETISAEVSPARLARFFSKEEHGYRVSAELRSSLIFTVQDVLADPPFSRLDLISCRNLLIYLRPEAQAKIISLFHFALREGGILLLGSSETIGNLNSRFEIVSKAERLYRHIGRSRPGELAFLAKAADGVRLPPGPRPGRPPSRQATYAELCRQLVVDSYAPAALLINRNNECLYSIGPIDRYLQMPPGHPTFDLLAMARQGLRTKLRAAIQQASQENARVSLPGGRTKHDGAEILFRIDVRPILSDGEELFLICFIDEPKTARKAAGPEIDEHQSRAADLERELAATRMELQGAIRNLEISAEEQKAITEEALSVNEEYQSTNEELLTSKEELQSLNEELTALNSQLQETLERQRTASNDLQNVLFSTDIATLFLDADLNIRFFTPSMKSFFSVIPGDIGRPLADLKALAADSALAVDAAAVLSTLAPIEREIEAPGDNWFSRRILPYRTQDNGVEGVVITFTDVTERKHAAKALELAKQQAELANIAKSRFLAAASHDLRQPLQTLALIEGLLAKTVEGDAAQKFVALLEPTLGAMTGMLNTLLDINQIDAGTVHAEIVSFPINEFLDRLRQEFAYHAEAQGLELRVVACGLVVRSDPVLLEQVIRNLLTNAMKYTNRGTVLLGCRRRGGMLGVEVWDTGIGIPRDQLSAVFDEFLQLDNAARERDRGLGLGLSIVRRLADLLGHRIEVRSTPGRGSVFSIEIPQPPFRAAPKPQIVPEAPLTEMPRPLRHTGTILVIEDDLDVRELLQIFLEHEGHHVAAARDGPMALTMVASGAVRPDLILADYNLPGGMNGLDIVASLLQQLHQQIPAIILTGDISTATLRGIAHENCLQLAKPVKMAELALVIQRLLGPSLPAARDVLHEAAVIFVVDDDRHVRGAIRSVLQEDGFAVEDFATCELFLDAYRPGSGACLLVDAYLPGMTGLELLQRLHDFGHRLPSIMITGKSDVAIAVQAMKAGAVDFIEKPIGRVELLACVARAIEEGRDGTEIAASEEAAARSIAGLTERQRQIMELVLAGHPSKNIASDLNISQRTVENHRALIMKKTGAKSLPALARLALIATRRQTAKPAV